MIYKLFGSTLSALLAATFSTASLAADHREAPLVNQDPAADINDIYAFRDPDDSGKMVFVLTVNGFSVPSQNGSYNFSSDIRYRILIDNTGDAIADASIDTVFSPAVPGPQGFRTTLPNGEVVAGPVTLPSTAPQPNSAIIVDDPSGASVFAGQRDDPFFFDAVGFGRFRAGTGTFSGEDAFANVNVSAIVISVPLSMIANGNNVLQIWGTTERNLYTRRTVVRDEVQQHYGQRKQIERMGNPAVSTVAIPGRLRDLFNVGQPVNDAANFGSVIVNSLVGLGTTPENIAILASVAVPDTLKFDLTVADGFPNGRRLEDDVIDTLLFFVLNQPEVFTGDGADGNDKPFLDSFPFLAEPHQPD